MSQSGEQHSLVETRDSAQNVLPCYNFKVTGLGVEKCLFSVKATPTLRPGLKTMVNLYISFNSDVLHSSQGARFLKIDLAQLSSQKRFDFRNS